MLRSVLQSALLRASLPMKGDAQKLTEGSLHYGIFFFSLPLIFSNLLQILFNVSDIAVVGRFSGSIALGAVGSTTTVVALFTGFLIGVGSGVNVIVARYMGQRNREELQESVHTAFLVCAGVGLLLCLFGEGIVSGLLTLLKTKEELLPGAVCYLRIYFLGIPALALFNFGNAVFSAAGDTKKPLLFLTASGVLNVLLNLFFVVGLHFDVEGVAIASVTAQYVSALLVLLSLRHAKEAYALHGSCLKLHRGKAALILSISMPAGLQNAAFQLANLFVQYGLNSFPAIVVSGHVAAQNADALVYDTMAAFYTACGSFIGQNYGAGQMDRVWKTYRISLLYAFLAGTLLGSGIALFGESFMRLFTTDPEVIHAGLFRLHIMGFFYGCSAIVDGNLAASRALGKGVVPTAILLLGVCLFRILWIFTVFAYFKTLLSLYLLFMVSWGITGIAEYAYFRKAYGEAAGRVA